MNNVRTYCTVGKLILIVWCIDISKSNTNLFGFTPNTLTFFNNSIYVLNVLSSKKTKHQWNINIIFE